MGISATTVIRAFALLEGLQIEAATREVRMLLARGVAIELAPAFEDPPVRVLAVGLLGFLSFFEALLQGWTEGMITRRPNESSLLVAPGDR